MACDNPEQYTTVGGLHIQRMTPEEAEADGFDPAITWICIAIKDAGAVNLVVVDKVKAAQIADSLKALAA